MDRKFNHWFVLRTVKFEGTREEGFITGMKRVSFVVMLTPKLFKIHKSSMTTTKFSSTPTMLLAQKIKYLFSIYYL